MRSTFNKKPVVAVQGREQNCVLGWKEIAEELKSALKLLGERKKVIVFETYQGVDLTDIKSNLVSLLQPEVLVDTSDLFLKESQIREITQADVTDDRVFGYLTRLQMEDLLSRPDMESAEKRISDSTESLVMVFGFGASLVWKEPDILVYADISRWEIQRRMRNNEVNNLGIQNRKEHPEVKYKRGFFVDWRICDRLKKKTMVHWDYVLDTNHQDSPKMATGEAVRDGLRTAARRPFSVVPFFDPGPWGGQWMKEKFNLDPKQENYAWCFNCVPEENSLLLGFGEITFEVPSINLVFFQAVELLGNAVHALFGDEFPIRFDFLDTVGGGNLSLQVHPLTSYIQEKFGMHYTQDESYYMLEAEPDASVYLGLKDGVLPEEMTRDLKYAEKQGTQFHVEKFVKRWPARKHDHFLIPAGTVHCSGTNGMVLEISATPYIFTFKLYDWGRLNADGRPRPINVAHGLENIQWDRTTEWTRRNLVNQVEKIDEGDGWTEESTGLHEREFIETRRHWFSKKVDHHTGGGVNVLNLVEGDEIIVESPADHFDPFIVHYAETFIVPAAVGAYTIRPHGPSLGKECTTIKAFVRTNP